MHRIPTLLATVLVAVSATATAEAATVRVYDDAGTTTALFTDAPGRSAEMSSSVASTTDFPAPFLRISDSAPITLDPTSAPGCRTEWDPAPSGDRYSVACDLGVIERVAVAAGDGNDSVIAFAGSADEPKLPEQRIDLGAGDDTFSVTGLGPAPRAFVTGGSGDDTVDTGAGDDVIDAGPGNDRVTAYGGDDTISGGAGNDKLYGDDTCLLSCPVGGRDVVSGGAGNDELSGGGGADRISGGAGNDRVGKENDGKVDHIDGGPGRNSLGGVDYRRRTYAFRDRISRFRTVFAGPVTDLTKWTCSGRRCKVSSPRFPPNTPYIIVVV